MMFDSLTFIIIIVSIGFNCHGGSGFDSDGFEGGVHGWVGRRLNTNVPSSPLEI